MTPAGIINEKAAIDELTRAFGEEKATKLVNRCLKYNENDHCETAAKTYDCFRTQFTKNQKINKMFTY